MPNPSPVDGITNRSAIRYASTSVSGAAKPTRRTRSATPRRRRDFGETRTVVALADHDIDDIVTARHEVRDRRDHPVMALVALARIEPADGQQHTLPGQSPGGAQHRPIAPRKTIARRKTRTDRIRHDDDPLGRQIGPGEHGGARMARDAQHQIGRFDRAASQPRRRRPDLDPMRLDDQAGARDPGDRRRERRQMHMAAEHEVGPLGEGRGDRPGDIAQLAAARRSLGDSLGQADRIAGVARQHRDRGKTRQGSQRGEEIAVVLRDPAGSAEAVGHQRETGQTGPRVSGARR